MKYTKALSGLVRGEKGTTFYVDERCDLEFHAYNPDLTKVGVHDDV